MSLPALLPPPEGVQGNVIRLPSQRTPEQLESENVCLKERLRQAENRIEDLESKERAHIYQNSLLSFGLIFLARRLVSSDDQARFYSALHGGNNDEKGARKHWRKNGGRDSFRICFHTAMDALRYSIPSPFARAVLRRMVERAIQ